MLAARLSALMAFATLLGGAASCSTQPGASADACAPTCGIGQTCNADESCVSKFCNANVCAEASCTDGKRNGTEEGLDCGGTCPFKCDGATCTTRDECRSGVCFDSKCAPAASKTCGVGMAKPCEENEKCGLDADCKSDYCNGISRCKPAPADANRDGRRNAGETDVDCGGTAAPAKLCTEGQKCATSSDCTGACTGNICQKASATDGKKNGKETDVDCGGADGPACVLTKACLVNTDCALQYCNANKCATPTDSDGVQNGSESAIDCGGPGVTEGATTFKAKRCRIDDVCAADGDCLSTSCAPSKKCSQPSCGSARAAGLTTCGTGEPGAPGAMHESCCRTLPLPTLPRTLDKYEITAGRFRSFLDKVGPNVRAWVSAYIAAKPSSQLAQLIAGRSTGTTVMPLVNIYPSQLKGVPLNLIAHMGLEIDNYDGVRGCSNTYGAYGHNSYWQPDADLAEYGVEPRPNAQAVTDAKSLNCAMPMMFAAFCAWDNDAELAKKTEYLDAWGTGTYPWGNTDIMRPNYLWCNGRPGTGGWTCQNTAIGMNGLFYEYPAGTDVSKDQSPFFAAPGRFPMDITTARVGTEGWMDFFGNMAEYTGEVGVATGDFCDFSAAPAAGAVTCTSARKPGQLGTTYTQIPRVGVIGRSWEGHNYGRGSDANAFPATFQYGKFGARCSRPLQ
jgi:hypothetical protein